jgi:hypothetical protein
VANLRAKPPQPFAKRVGPLTQDERALIFQFLADQPHEVTDEQIGMLARLMHRYPKTVRRCIEQAREEFVMRTRRYLDVHMEATEKALAEKDYATAARHAEWALENLGVEGTRVIDRSKSDGPGTKVYVRLLPTAANTVEVESR